MDQQRVHVGVPDRFVVRRDLLLGVLARLPLARVLVEDLDRRGRRGRCRARRPSRGRRSGRRGRRSAFCARGSSMLPRCSGSASRPRPRARSTSAARALRSTTGCSPAGRAGSWCCGSRTRTASAPRRRTSARSSRRSSGSASTTTASRSSSRSAPTATARSSRQLLDAGHAYRSTAGPGRGPRLQGGQRQPRLPRRGRGGGRGPPARARRGRDHRGRRRPRRDAVRERAPGRPRDRARRRLARLPPRGRRRRRRRRHHPRRPRRRPLLQHAQARAHPAGDGRADARLRPPAAAARAGRQEALQAPRRGVRAGPARRGYLPEAVRNYLALLGWGYDEETTFFTTEQLQELFTLERVSKSPAVFDEQKLRWINGRYVRELPVSDLTARLEALLGRTGLRGGRRGHAGEDLHARRVLAAGALVLRGPGRRSGRAREVPRAGCRRGGARRRPRGARSGARAVDARDGRGGAARRRSTRRG